MKKLFSIVAATLFAASMFAVTFNASDFSGKGAPSPGSEIKLTKGDVTVEVTRGYGSGNDLRIFAAVVDQKTQKVETPAGVLKITSADKNITKVHAEFTDNSKGTFEDATPNAKTWSIEAEKQFRITKLVVSLEGVEEEEEKPAQNLGEKTIAEFLTLKNFKDTCVLTGIVSNIKMDSKDATKYNAYGNFDLNGINGDNGKIYVYGLLTADGEQQKFIEMGIDASDTLTIKAVYSEYNGTPQAVKAVFVSVKKGNGEVPGGGEDPGEGDPETPEGVITCAAAAELANALATPEVGKSTTGTQSVTVRGYVIFAYDMKDGKQDAWLADNAGAKSGAIQAYKATVTSAVAKGDYVEATGTVAKYYKKGKDGKENEIILELVNGTMKKVSSGGGEEPGEEEELEFSYEYEPTEKTTENVTMKYMSLTDYTAEYGTVYIVMSDDPTGDPEKETKWAEFEFKASSYDVTKGIPAGTYQISDTEAEGTFVASPGMEVTEEYDYPSYYAYLDGEYMVPYYLVSGTVTVTATQAGVKVVVAAKSYNGSTINITYDGMPEVLEPEIEPEDPYEPDVPGEEGVENVTAGQRASKVMIDGKLYILRNGVKYNAVGAQVK